ncbi:MAG: YbaK/EbsC family protein [Actinobacteria bacterium]|nr:MAG: YbaK/EbsC family protein [Actinomycetota bacterium]
MTTTELIQALARSELGFELLSHQRTETAAEEAAALGISPEEVAKTIVLIGENGWARIVLPASERVDLRKVGQALGEGKRVRLANEEELVAAYPMFELGAVPPFGGPKGDRVLEDRRVAGRASVVFEAGSHGDSIRMKTAHLLKLSGGEVADVCRD